MQFIFDEKILAEIIRKTNDRERLEELLHELSTASSSISALLLQTSAKLRDILGDDYES
jgi:hypothetical protein